MRNRNLRRVSYKYVHPAVELEGRSPQWRQEQPERKEPVSFFSFSFLLSALWGLGVPRRLFRYFITHSLFRGFFIVVRAVDVEGRQQRERQALHPMLSYEFSIWKWARREEEEEPHLYRHVASCFAFSIAVSSPLHPFLPPLCLLPITYVIRMLKCGLV